jgi:predicted TPR repeat methyltransferase
MAKSIYSSGDLTADRRADYARMLADAGDLTAAADLMRQALDLAPGWGAGWFSLGVLLEKSKDLEAACEAFVRSLELSPDDVFGSGLRLAALGRAMVPETPPAAYVEKLFDDYAERFDKALVETLGYSIPEKLTALVFAHAPEKIARAVDLGCGTGLVGERLRQRVSFLSGFDLSRGMLAKAAEKGIYDRLEQADLAVDAGGLLSPASEAERADLVTAGDVLMYFGNLDPVFETAAALTMAGGHFAFSVEDGDSQAEWQLQPSLRYRHGEAYVRDLCAGHGFEIVEAERTPIRRDGDQKIIGLIVLARRLGSGKSRAEMAGHLTPRPADEPRPH